MKMTTLLFTVGAILIVGGFVDSFFVQDRSALHIVISMVVKVVGIACLALYVLLVLQDGGE